LSDENFQSVLHVLVQDEWPDQTADVSVFKTIFAAKTTPITIGWITMERKLLLVVPDVDSAQRKILSAVGFRQMVPYLWKAVTDKTITEEVQKLSKCVPLRNPISLGSRVLKILKVRLPDKALGIAS